MELMTRISFSFCQFNTFIQGTVGVLCQPPDIFERRLVLMVTYSDLFTFIIMLCAVITLAINIMHKK